MNRKKLIEKLESNRIIIVNPKLWTTKELEASLKEVSKENCHHHFLDNREVEKELGKEYRILNSKDIAIPIICEKCGKEKWEIYSWVKDVDNLKEMIR